MLNLEHIGQGRTSDIFKYEDGKVLKLFKPVATPDSVENEYKNSRYVYSLGLPIPRPFELVENNNRVGIVFQYVPGLTMLKVIGQKPWTICNNSIELARLHSNIHKESGEGLTRNLKEEVRYSINEASLLSENEKQIIIKQLNTFDETNKLCHGDFHPDNILLGNKSWIIDWMNGMAGDPAGDVARTILLLSIGTMPEGMSKQEKLISGVLRSIMKRVYIRKYLELSSLHFSQVEQWILPMAAARLAEAIPVEEKGNLLKLIKSRIVKCQ